MPAGGGGKRFWMLDVGFWIEEGVSEEILSVGF